MFVHSDGWPFVNSRAYVFVRLVLTVPVVSDHSTECSYFNLSRDRFCFCQTHFLIQSFLSCPIYVLLYDVCSSFGSKFQNVQVRASVYIYICIYGHMFI